MAIETIKKPKVSFVYEWTCAYEPCGAVLRGTVADAKTRATFPRELNFECPHCARWTGVVEREL